LTILHEAESRGGDSSTGLAVYEMFLVV
jgi:hypothetical protein